MDSCGTAKGFTFPMCDQCGQSFDRQDHSPLLLPCGDVFCKECLHEQEDADNQLCQKCNVSWSHSNISQLPVVLDLDSGGTNETGAMARKVPSCFPSCNCCRRNYNPSSYKPFLLPCGHCFCRSCLETLRNSGNSVCSVCRSDWATEDMTKLRCVRTLVHPSNVNSEDHQSPDGHNHDSWSHDEPSNYPRTDRPGGGTEILTPKEACAVNDNDSGVFSGGSLESSRSSVTSSSDTFFSAKSVLSDQKACPVNDNDSGVFSGGSSEISSQDTFFSAKSVMSDQDAFFSAESVLSVQDAFFSAESVLSDQEDCVTALKDVSSAKSQNGYQPAQTMSGATAAKSQNGYQPAQTPCGATVSRNQNSYQPAQTQSSATTARRRNSKKPAPAAQIQPESPHSGGWSQSNYNNAHYVTSQRTEQGFCTTSSAPVIPPAPKKSQIFVRNNNLSVVYQLDPKRDSVDTLTSLIFERTGRKPEILMYGGKQLQEGRTLASYNVQPDATIYQTCRGLGGRQELHVDG